jgi:hypothetical protein
MPASFPHNERPDSALQGANRRQKGRMPQIKLCHLCLSTALGFGGLFAASAHGFAAGAPAAQAAATASNRILGTVTAATAASVTVHTASNGDVTVALTPQTRLLRANPGEKSLKDAAIITAADLATGDRAVILLAAGAAQPTASILVAMKQGDIQQANARETADWRQNGIAGIAEAVDSAAGTITLKPQSGLGTSVIHTTASTVFRRYAPDSTAFADSKQSSLADIHPGDQVRARGPREENGASIDAEEVVAGSFRDIAGTVLKTDPSANTITLKNLATKKAVTLYLDASTQLRKLPTAMAERLAHSKDASQHAGGGTYSHHPEEQNEQASEGEHHMGARHGDTADMLAEAPSIPLSDLKKGDAVMVVASGTGAAKPTAITIVSGVEPLLEAPAGASENVFSASWNLGGGDAAAQAAPQR